MGAIKLDQATGSLEITYGGRDCPFGGVDSTAPDPYIGPGQLTQDSINALVNNGSLLATFFNTLSINNTSVVALLGYGELNGQVFFIFIAPDGKSVQVIGLPNFPSSTGSYTIGIFDTSSVFNGNLNLVVKPNSLTYKNINGVCYFSFPGCPFIFQHNNQSLALLTSYLGASYLSELNGRLIAANVWQVTNVSTNSYSPTTQGTGVGSTAINGGVVTNTSAVINTFPNQAVSGGQLVNLTVTLAGSFNANPQGNGVNQAYIQFYYSKDSGVTWIGPFFDWIVSANNATLASQQITIPNISGLTNLNTLQLKIVSWASAATGTSTVAAINGTLSAETAVIETSTTITVTNFPYQYAWSAPQGAYSQFNPLTTQNGISVATGAGFNNLPDVEDVITGLISTGPTQFVLRSQGITEVTPLSSGINPLSFDHLWASHKGIGSNYPNTISQYGSLGGFFSDTDIFTLGYSGLNSISFKALSAIYQDLIGTCKGNNIAGGMGPVYINGEVTNVYILAACDNTNNPTIYIWMFNFRTNEWFRFQNTHGHAITGLQVISVNLAQLQTALNYNTTFIVLADNNSDAFVLSLTTDGSLPNFSNGNPLPVNPKLVFQAEELLPLRDISIDGILIYYNGTETNLTKLQVNLSVNGLPFTALDDTNDQVDGNWHYAKLSPTAGTLSMGYSPQLTIDIPLATDVGNNSIQFGKIVLLGGIDPSQRPL